MCSVDCGTHGVCIGGACRCEEGWTGAACDQRVCHPRCIEHGTCKDGKCECREGWNGEHCTIGRQTAGTETGTYCFIFINRRSIVTVAHCNWLFPQGHVPSNIPLPLQISVGSGKGESEVPALEKPFPSLQDCILGWKEIQSDHKPYPKRASWGGSNAHAWETVSGCSCQAPYLLSFSLSPLLPARSLDPQCR